MRDFLRGVTDAINVKLVRVYDDNTTSLAWKLAGELERFLAVSFQFNMFADLPARLEL